MPWLSIAIVFLIVVLVSWRVGANQAKAKRAAQKAAEQEQKRKEEAKRRIEEEKKRKEEAEKESARICEDREAAISKQLDLFPESKVLRLPRIQEEVHAALLNITQFTPISKRRYISFDLETTGLNSGDDAIVEIGAVRVENNQITAEYHQMVDPGRPMPEDAAAINHITDDMLRGQLKIYEALPGFLSFVGEDVLAAHNAPFDARFIQQACMRYRFKAPERFFDTLDLARYWPEASNRKLGTLLKAAGVKNELSHRALGDAKAVAAFISATNERRKKPRKTNEGDV